MNKSEIEVISNLIKRLRANDCSPEIKEQLTSRYTSLFLETWVIGPMELLVAEERSKRDLDLAVRMSR